MADPIIKFERRCPRCGEVHPITAFPRNKNRPDGRGVYCKACQAAWLKAYRATPRGREAHLQSHYRSIAKAKARYEAAVAELSDDERARLGR